MANWRHEAAEAVGTETAHTGGTARVDGDTWQDLGAARTTDDGLAVDLRGTSVGTLLDVRLAGAEGPRGGAAVPVGARLRHGVLWLDDPGPVPPECDRVWARIDAADHRAALLADLGFAPLADRLAAGKPDRAHGDPQRACFLPGVRLIWGAPGTGKTTLLTRAATELAEAGHRVLLLSRAEQTLPVTVDAARASVQQQLVDIAGAGQRLAELRRLLADFDPSAFAAVQRRIDDQDRADALEAKLVEAQRVYDVAAADLAQARQELRRARDEWEQAEDGRRRLTESRALSAKLADVDAELARLHLKVERRRYRGRSRDRTSLYRMERERDALRQRVETATDAAISAERASALDTALSDAHHWLDEAARDESEAYTRVESLHAKIAQLRSAKPSEQDLRFHADCLDRGLPELQDEYDELARLSDEQAARRGQLEERLWWLGERARADRDERLVHTDRLPHGDVGEAFDVVLVDDAGTRSAAEVLAAVGLAKHTAVIAGDAGSPQPWVVPSLRDDAAVRRWCGATVLAHCGIRTEADARSHPGCYVLTTPPRRISLDATRGGRGAEGTTDGDGVIVLDTGGEAVRHEDIVASLPRGTAIIAPHRTAAATWSAAARQRLDLAVGTARTMHGAEFDAVLVDLVSDDWRVRTRAFASATTRARCTLYLLADAAALAEADPGTPLGRVRAAQADVRPVGRIGVPAPRATAETGVMTPWSDASSR